jgi:hypothetical protein
MPYLDELFGGFGLSLGFSDQSRLMLRPLPAGLDNGDPDDFPPVADWELFTPFKRYLRVGPGSKWAYLPSMGEEKAGAAG